ncbi:MAG: hypothetical protein WDZ91_06790 [Paenibacillaceae bacterium]
MKQAGIPPNEKTQPSRFWSLSKKVMSGKVKAEWLEWIKPCQMELFDESIGCESIV